MNKPFTRRHALKSVARASVGGLLGEAGMRSQQSAILVAGRPVEVLVTAVSQLTARLTIRQVLDGKVAPIPSDGALLKEDWGKKPALRLRARHNSRVAACGDLRIELSGSPLRLRVSTKLGNPIQELTIDQDTGNLSFTLGEGPLLGLGQGGPQFDRRGNFDQMTSGQGGYRLGTHGGRVPIQLLIGTSGWGLFVHQPLGSFDLMGRKGILRPDTTDSPLPLDVFVIGAQDPQGILAEYALITGYPEMIPPWSLGYLQSHRTLGSPEEIIQEAKTFREKELPCDAMIYLGTGFCPEGWNTGNGEFAWNSRMFPEPQKAIDQLHANHFKVVPHVVVEGGRLTGSVRDPCRATPLPSGKTQDGHWPPDRQVSCYWPVHKALFDLNVDGWWPDQGDGLDSASRLARNRMYFEGSQVYRPNERVFALHRNGYAGMQRYAAFLWSGDVQSTWETLKVHVSVGINAGLSGIPYWGTDIGGFIPTKEYTGELFARWFQFAAFNPLFRSHGRDWRLHLPWGWTVGEIGYPETASYQPDQNVLHDHRIEPICKKYLELRYRMMPYLYSVVRQTCVTGLPIIRALWLHYPDDPTAVARGDEYLYGPDILVAPVVEKDAASRTLYLPRGSWYDFWTQAKLEGGREIARAVDLETIPLYCRAGAIIPTGPVKQYAEEHVDAPLTLSIYPGADGHFSLYEDDGKTFNFRRGEFMQIDISWNDSRRSLALSLAKGSRMLDMPQRRFLVRVVGQPSVREIIFQGSSSTLNM